MFKVLLSASATLFLAANCVFEVFINNTRQEKQIAFLEKKNKWYEDTLKKLIADSTYRVVLITHDSLVFHDSTVIHEKYKVIKKVVPISGKIDTPAVVRAYEKKVEDILKKDTFKIKVKRHD